MTHATLPYASLSSPDASERERLLLEHLPDVHYIARRIHERLPAQVQLEDLVQAGVMGLMDALQKYDPAHNAQLGTYARFRIRGAILDSLRALDWSPRDLRRQARALQQAQAELRERLGREPQEGEVADALALAPEQFHALVAALHALELDPGPANEAGATALDTAISPEPGPFSLCQRSETRALLAQALDELPERDRQILSLYYFEELTMKEVGAVMGIGESRISQIHSALLARLRGMLAARVSAPAPAARAAARPMPPGAGAASALAALVG